MPLAHRTKNRWRIAWSKVGNAEVETLHKVIQWAEQNQWSVGRIADEAEIPVYDVRYFLEKESSRSRHGPGLRLLWFVTEVLRYDNSITKPDDIAAGIDALAETAARLATFEPDADHFFRHLQRLGLADETECKSICDRIAGQYYSHRLSRTPGMIIRSHYEFMKYSPFNRLPHVVNRLRYGAAGDMAAVKRTAEGQIIRLGQTYALIAFVSQGYRAPGRKLKTSIIYHGIQINLFPAGQLSQKWPSEIDGIFLSYVYHNSYEMGRMRLVRRASKAKPEFDEDQVGEFTHEQIRTLEPTLDLSNLKLDVSDLIESTDSRETMLAACLSFLLTHEELSLNPPSDRSKG